MWQFIGDDNGKKKLKFVRRVDLTSEVRLEIACKALLVQISNEHGSIGGLARQFMVSRTFVYMLLAAVKETEDFLFDGKINSNSIIDYRTALTMMLSLKLEGGCSNGAISVILKRMESKISALGSISQYLAFFGSLLPNTLSTNDGTIQRVVFLNDGIDNP